jgi:hypothetical protein
MPKQTLEQIKAKIAKLEAQQSKRDDVSNTFYLGMVGGSGKPVKRLNEKKLVELDHVIDRANELVELYKRRDHLIAQEQAPQQRAKYEAYEEVKKQVITEQLRDAKPGDDIVLFTGSRVTIKRVNPKSITSLLGTRYGISEIMRVVKKGEISNANH